MSTKHTIAAGDDWRVYRADFGEGSAYLEVGADCEEIEIPDEVAAILSGRAERQVAAVREVLALLDERVEILRRPGDPSLAAYFEGRDAGEMAGTQQAADAIRRALETE